MWNMQQNDIPIKYLKLKRGNENICMILKDKICIETNETTFWPYYIPILL